MIGFMVIISPLFIGHVVNAAGLIPCGGSGEKECDFNFFMQMINGLITFLLFVVATPMAALAFAYAGWLYISSQGSEGNVTKAKSIMTNVFWGYIIALAAWLIVNTILKSLGVTGTFLS